MTDIRVEWQAGRFDVTRRQFDAMLDEALSECDVLLLTECYSAWMHRKIRKRKGWGSTTRKRSAIKAGGRWQNVIMWRTGTLTQDGAFQRVTTSGKQWRNRRLGPLIAPVVVPVVTLRHKVSGERVQFASAHLPSHVQGIKVSGRISGPPAKVAAWKADVEGLRRIRGERPHAVPFILGADTNIDLRLAWCRKEWSRVGGRLAWTKPKGKPWKAHPGTHRAGNPKRLIDALNVTGGRAAFGKPRILKRRAGFDHLGQLALLHIRPRRSKQRGH